MFPFQSKLRRPPCVSLGRDAWKAHCALFPAAFVLFAAAVQLANADPLAVKVGVIHQAHSRETISILDIPPADDFIAGARMAMYDNNTTGRFLDQSFSVVDAKLAPGEDPIASLKEMLADWARFSSSTFPRPRFLRSPTRPVPLARWCSMRARLTTACAKRTVEPT
jgi:hypothetical protein